VVRGILSIVGQEGFEIFNLQGSTMVTLRDVVETSGKLFGKSVTILESAPDNVSIRTVSGEKAKERLGFEPSISIHEGLESVAKFLGLLG
jgi:nucleoside-diphosphate-sugar epimerase